MRVIRCADLYHVFERDNAQVFGARNVFAFKQIRNEPFFARTRAPQRTYIHRDIAIARRREQCAAAASAFAAGSVAWRPLPSAAAGARLVHIATAATCSSRVRSPSRVISCQSQRPRGGVNIFGSACSWHGRHAVSSSEQRKQLSVPMARIVRTSQSADAGATRRFYRVQQPRHGLI